MKQTSFGVVHRVGPSKAKLRMQLLLAIALSWAIIIGVSLCAGAIVAYCRGPL